MLLLTTNWTAYSATTTTSEQKANLEKGQVAPFRGVILTRPALAKIITKYEAQIANLKLEVEKAKREQAILVNAEKVLGAERLKACELRGVIAATGNKTVLNFYKTEFEKSRGGPPWYNSPQLHFVFGVLVSGGFCALWEISRNQK